MWLRFGQMDWCEKTKYRHTHTHKQYRVENSLFLDLFVFAMGKLNTHTHTYTKNKGKMHIEACFLLSDAVQLILFLLCMLFVVFFIEKSKITTMTKKGRSQNVYNLKRKKNIWNSWKPGNNFTKKSEISFSFFSLNEHSQWVEIILILISWERISSYFFSRKKNLCHFMHQFIRISIFFLKKMWICWMSIWMREKKTVYWLLFQKLASNEYMC